MYALLLYAGNRIVGLMSYALQLLLACIAEAAMEVCHPLKQSLYLLCIERPTPAGTQSYINKKKSFIEFILLGRLCRKMLHMDVNIIGGHQN
jgi:hypothetical protein